MSVIANLVYQLVVMPCISPVDTRMQRNAARMTAMEHVHVTMILDLIYLVSDIYLVQWSASR